MSEGSCRAPVWPALIAALRTNRNAFWRSKASWRNGRNGVALLALLLSSFPVAAQGRLSEAVAAFHAHQYAKAAAIFEGLAAVGDAQAQAYLGFMYFNGKGVPQNYAVAAGWYRCASQQGFPTAQYMLGLMYDKGEGVPQDFVTAYALVNLAVAGAGPERDPWARIRDAIGSKLTLNERNRAQELSFVGVPPGPCLPIVRGFVPE